MQNLQEQASTCNCGHHEKITLETVEIGNDALEQVAQYTERRQFQRMVLVVDNNTFEAAGERLQQLLSSEAEAIITLCTIDPNASGDVVADEASIVQLMLSVEPGITDVIIAVGAGTIHDITRFAAYHMHVPFISVPTAPSVDGFTSKGAPVLLRGSKITIPASGPIAIFADSGVLTQAPQELIAAGFGDMLGKYTSLLDWQYGRHTAGEPYCEAAYRITRDALVACVSQAEAIGARTEQGIRTLTEALIASGLAMLLFGQSHPASGAEHHLSHYWEMAYLRRGKRQLLHGAKVAVACAEVARMYRELAAEGDPALFPEPVRAELLARIAADVPEPSRLRELLRTVGAPVSPDELGVDEELLHRSLQEAQHVRPNRHTLLKAFNEQRLSTLH
ncbi:glycerol-1-phosphate dehydrogenase [Paenibacillus swuensis]|uniref:Glycerol-1-phosphate dehydrogenase n=1 Tax=Paenibacillus swuensis TaxID=1178515 RepID=A0A172TPW6_9BACL|nr:glycerol-1-phosphate dehydrogenase [Paenibacillus swuensis]